MPAIISGALNLGYVQFSHCGSGSRNLPQKLRLADATLNSSAGRNDILVDTVVPTLNQHRMDAKHY